MMKKLFAICLTIAMMATMIALPVAAEEVYDYIPEEVFFLRDVNLSELYSNGKDGSYEVEDGVLHMVKDKAGSNFSEILWSDAEDAMTDAMTLAFDAKVSGGYGTSWDGYAISLRTDTGDDVEMVRLVPTATGVDITKGSGRDIIASVYGTGYHAYTLVYNKGNDTLTVYVDGKEIMYQVALGFTGKKQHGFLIKSSNLEATGAELWMGEAVLWQNEYYIRSAPILGDGIVPTMPPTAEPTDPPAPGTPVKIRDLDVSKLYSNGKDGTYEVNNGILYMVKDKEGSNFNEILWADQEDSRTETTTFAFDAMVKGGVGTSWDGYTVALRTFHGGNCELVRMVPTETGVDLTIGAGRAILAQVEGTGYHAYSVVFNKGEDTVTVYADGVKVIDGAALGWGTNVQNGYYIHSGNNNATGVELRMGNVELWDGAYVRTAPSLDASATKAPTAPPTAVPTAKPTKAPVTAPPTAPPTAVPTEKPVTPAPTELPPGDYFIRNVDVYGVYSNGPNGSYEVLDNPYHGELHMVKDKPGSNFSAVLWSDVEDAMTDTVTLAFDAKVSGGYGTSWDGFAIALWQTDYGNCELVRMVPTATGVDITRGAGGKTIAKVAGTGYHAYTCVYNKAQDWVTVYVDGDKVIDGAKLGFTGKTQHGYFINSGHNDATGAEMWLGEVETWKYASYVRTAPLLTDGQTLPPKPEVTPTPAPGTPQKIRDIDLSGLYSNGSNGSYDVQDGVLHMVKDKTGTNFSEILWADKTEEFRTADTSFVFDAKVKGGVGNSWDGYAISLRYRNAQDYDLLRLIPTETGVAIAKSAGGDILATVDGTGYHAYSIVYNRDQKKVTVYADGVKVIDNATITVPADTGLQGFMIKSGHNDATGVELWMGDVETWTETYIRKAPFSDVTHEPTPEPTPVCTTGEPTAPPEPERTPDCNYPTPQPTPEPTPVCTTGEPELTGSVSIEGDAECTIYVGDTVEFTAITTLQGEPTYYEPWIFHWWANTPDVIRIDQPQTLFNYSNKAKVTALAEGDVVLTVDADFFLSPSRSTSLYATDSVIIHVKSRDAEPTPHPWQPTKETLTIAKVTAPLGEGYADVEVPITLAGVDNAAGLQIALTYQDGLTLKSIRKGEALPSLTFTRGDDLAKKPIVLLWDGEHGDTDPNGVVAYLTFTVPVENEDTYMITATIQALYDDDMKDIYATVFTGSIAVKKQLIGDVTGDNVLNAKDVTMIRRMIATPTRGMNQTIADVNGDGVVNAKDITLLRRMIAQGANE